MLSSPISCIWLMIWVLCLAISATNTQKATPIVYTTIDRTQNNKVMYHYSRHNVEKISEAVGPYRIISIVGEQRIGKSSMLNEIISMMLEKKMTPFVVGHELTAETRGVWMYVVKKCDSCNRNPRQDCQNEACINSDYSYVFLDIEGSDSCTDDIALRYASIVTLLSSKIFMYIQKTVMAHHVSMLNHIERFRKVMHQNNMNFNFEDVDLNIIIREPLGHVIGEQLQSDINKLFEPFIGYGLNENSKLAQSNEDLTVLKIDHFRDPSYVDSMKLIVEYILQDASYKKSDKTIEFGAMDSNDIAEFIFKIIDELNTNPDLNKICIGCVFEKIVQWNDWSEWSQCSKKCDSGFKIKKRKCNTGRVKDCIQHRSGPPEVKEKCNDFDCRLLEWGEWDEWSRCSKSCGGGTQDTARACKTGNNDHCIVEHGGETHKTRSCNTHVCYNLVCHFFGVFC